MKLKHLFPILASFVLLCTSCKKEVNQTGDIPDYLIFGHYYGECIGESCIEIFCLEPSRLLEDANDNYPNSSNFYVADFYELSTTQFNLANGLMDSFPDTLLTMTETVIGQPDYADGGGLYIEYHVGDVRRFWLIDQSKYNVPVGLHEFIDKVNEKIDLINN